MASNTVESVSEAIKNNSAEIVCVVATTIAYQLYTRIKKQEAEKVEKSKEGKLLKVKPLSKPCER